MGADLTCTGLSFPFEEYNPGHNLQSYGQFIRENKLFKPDLSKPLQYGYDGQFHSTYDYYGITQFGIDSLIQQVESQRKIKKDFHVVGFFYKQEIKHFIFVDIRDKFCYIAIENCNDLIMNSKAKANCIIEQHNLLLRQHKGQQRLIVDYQYGKQQKHYVSVLQ
ncbi:Hypothetical_protein [Hexamita inflata]|uniref:Hypothetical_protein n=1 Tax=Hexamita inflata TaxID=28002 RepID=A0ABP1GXN8_9EUKA